MIHLFFTPVHLFSCTRAASVESNSCYLRPQGSMEVVCEVTGEWSRPLSRCVNVLCAEPPALQNAVIVGENYELGNKVHYVCKEG